MISVIMSTHNGSNTIDYAIKSILNQTYKNFEFIICDDGSIDNSYKHILKFYNIDNRIIPIKNKINLGLQKSLNKCIRLSKGKYIARMDDDDISKYDRFERQINFLHNNSSITFVGSNINLIDNSRKLCGKQKFITFPNKLELFKKDEFCHPTIMIKNNILKNIGGYSVSKRFYRIEDHELWLRLYAKGYRGANISDNLLNYTFDINSKNNKFYDYFNRFRLLLRYKNILNINFLGYIYVMIPLFKIITPYFIRNLFYKIRYNDK